MFTVRVNDLFSVAGRGMVLAGRVESGKVSVGDQAILRTPIHSVAAVIAGVERGRSVVSFASVGEEVALLVRGVVPEELKGGLELVEGSQNRNAWRVTSLEIIGHPKRWWEIWK